MKPKILILEDDAFIAMDIQDTFEACGFEVIGPFASVTQSLKHLENNTPDVAALDYNLGQETSLPIAKALSSSGIPFMFVTGQMNRVVKETIAADIPVITKPFHPDDLIQCANDLIKSS